MGVELSAGTVINTSFGETWTVSEKLGDGGQGYVYLVERGTSKKALKWYKPQMISATFCEHIRNNVISGSPSSGFIWPIDTVENDEGGFGYIMELKPEGYYDMEEILLKIKDFKSFRRVIDASLNIVNELRILHNKGCSYQDLNDGNFFIDPIHGRVKICDNDNVATNGTSTGVLGKPRYMAPEIVKREKMPDIYSDRFSLALIIFRLMTMGHPLEGCRSVGRTLTPELQKALYGTDPVFIFDPDDKRNAPDQNIHRNEIAIWSCLPQYMKDIFIQAFNKEGLTHPNRRPTEADWVDALVRFRSNIIECSCGNEVFVPESGVAVCEKCGRTIDIPYWLELPEYDIPGMRDSRIYRCQTCISDPDQALDPVGRVLAAKDNTGKLGIRNMSDETWDAVTTKGKDKRVEPKGVVPLKPGIRFNVNGSTITIKGGR